MLSLIFGEYLSGQLLYIIQIYDIFIDIFYIVQLQKMTEQTPKSPQQLLKRSQIISSPKNNNSRVYLPSRYAQERKTDKVGFQDILNSIQSKTVVDNAKAGREGSPLIKIGLGKNQVCLDEKKPKTSKFKSRPLKRQKNDQIQYNQIFLNPRQDALQQLRKKSSLEDNLKAISKQYQKLLRTQKGQAPQPSPYDPRATQQPTPIKKQNYAEVIELLESGDVFGINIQATERDFYDNHILIEPPDFPVSENSQAASNYSPSIPSNYKTYKALNLKELLMRARASMSGEDVQKQAHLSYILGQVYSEKKMFEEALKFHRRFLGFAKSMQDYVGMSLGANRVAISYYNCGQVQKSIIFHNQNLKLSNNDNCFVGFYNIGIAYRKLNKLNQALQYFQSALAWSQERGQQQSECIALGQIGVTYQMMQLYQQSIQKFQKSSQLCQKLKKQQLKLHNLRYILRISTMLNLKTKTQIQNIVEQAFLLAKNTSKLNIFDIFRCNIGIVKGNTQMKMELAVGQEANQIQEI